MVKSLMLLIRLDDSRVDNTEGNSKSGSIQYSLPVFFYHWLESCTLWKILDSDHCIILRRKIQNANHALVTIAKYTTHKNNLILTLGLNFFVYGMCWVLKYLICFFYLRSKEKRLSQLQDTGIPVSWSNRTDSGFFSRKEVYY